jgi:hypothetical protein
LAVLASGLLHLKIWNSKYRSIPSHAVPGVWVVKDGFPAQAAVCVVLVLLLLFMRKQIVWVGAILVMLGSILALVLSHQASIFGWQDHIWDSDAKEVIVVEVVAVIALALTLVFDFAHIDAENDLATL